MLGHPEDVAWLRLEDASAVGTARRSVNDVAERLGFSPSRAAEVALATTELATNAVVHAQAGAILVRIRRMSDRGLVEIVVVDSGPGVEDIAELFEDGRSTRGTLGIGLGAVQRLANRFEAYSQPGQGSVMHGVFADDIGVSLPATALDGLTRPILGEEVCGDAWFAVRHERRTSLMVADGLGHGELAAAASREAIESFRQDPWCGPANVIERAHRRLAHTRGAAVFALEMDSDSSTVRWSGAGNVVGRVANFERSRAMLSTPGIVGHRMGRTREDSLPVDPGSVVVVHSDGLTNKWELRDWSSALGFGPTVISTVLLREAGLRQDDASVVVLRA